MNDTRLFERSAYEQLLFLIFSRKSEQSFVSIIDCNMIKLPCVKETLVVEKLRAKMNMEKKSDKVVAAVKRKQDAEEDVEHVESDKKLKV